MRKVAEVEETEDMTEMTEMEVMEAKEVLGAEVTEVPEEDIREDRRCFENRNHLQKENGHDQLWFHQGVESPLWESY
jgi:hypothetical protein